MPQQNVVVSEYTRLDTILSQSLLVMCFALMTETMFIFRRLLLSKLSY